MANWMGLFAEGASVRLLVQPSNVMSNRADERRSSSFIEEPPEVEKCDAPNAYAYA